MAPRSRPLLARLLPKIRIPGLADTLYLESLVKTPLDDWPDAVRKPPWQWVGAAARACAQTVVVRGITHYQRRTARPSFKVGGKRVPVHRLIYELFIDRPPALRYHQRPTDFLDVNPAHWVPEDRRRSHASKQVEVEVLDEELAGLIEILEERAAGGRPLTSNLIYLPEMVERALDLADLRPMYDRQVENGVLPAIYQPVE
jgi:hypothetical protein